MDAITISETEPTGAFTGRMWHKLSTGQAYIRLGSVWIPFAAGGILRTFGRTTLYINRVDMTDYLIPNSLAIEDVLTKEANTCSFTIDDTTGTNKPLVGQEVLIYYRPTESADPELIFGGRITDVPQDQFTLQKYTYEINCVDYTQDLRRNLVADTFISMTAGAIIRSIIGDYAKGIGTYYVQDGETIEYIAFNYLYPENCITQLAELIGYDWYVDYEKNLHFFAPGTNAAPYSLTDDVNDGEYRFLEIVVDKSQLRNKQVIRGGYQYSSLFTEEQVADGTQLSFNLKYEPYTPVSVYVNTVAHTLGIDNVDTTGFDFVVNQAEKNIKNLDHAVLAAGAILKVTYKYKMPILAQIEDSLSIQAMKELEGGDGIYEGELIVDENIVTKETALLRAQSELDQYSNPLVEGNFTTIQYGYRSGQLLTVNIPSRGINSTYLIRQVSISSYGNGLLEYNITFASKLKGLTDFLIALYDESRKSFDRTDETVYEVLNTYKVLTDDFIIVDIAATESRRDITATPYVWCADGGGTAGKGQYNKAEWQ